MSQPKKPDLSIFRAGKHSECGVTRALAQLSPADRELFQAALAEPTITHAAIRRELKKRVPECPSAQTIGRHRTKGCSCDR